MAMTACAASMTSTLTDHGAFEQGGAARGVPVAPRQGPLHRHAPDGAHPQRRGVCRQGATLRESEGSALRAHIDRYRSVPTDDTPTCCSVIQGDPR